MEKAVDVRDLLTDGWCCQAMLDLVSSTDMGNLVPGEDVGGAGSDVL